MLSDELEFTAPFIEADFSADDDLDAVSRDKTDPLIGITKHGTAELGLIIL